MSLPATLILTALVLLSSGCGGAQRSCPAGMRWDECAHGSCPLCDDCVADCAPE